ncbi:glycoside hydrolase family 130 protein [Alicyclobacillus shizuokensis]|uniref:glycoside hydrolase family 130 protein n=1 Tax=Alicyclobacillus shizuokensis TaxID=392014 RepID=UPI000A7C31D1|nr:glycoside hydrolase family 130 protein [Alicyclobacillus shizuokensis]
MTSNKIGFPLGPFTKYELNPILGPQGNGWEAKDLFNPTAVAKDGKIYMLYRAEDHSGSGRWNGTSRIGLAFSEDGIRFQRHPQPVLVPTEGYELPGGCEDPRVTQVGATYYMTYTAFDGRSAYLCLATSKDLFTWEKHGILFPEWRGGSDKVWSKSGAILSTPIDGRYVMYFGDTSIWMAHSKDLIHWTPVAEPVLRPSTNPDAFDSALIEPGPQPVLTDQGILLIYNAARRIDNPSSPQHGQLHYASGQALLAKEDPLRVLKRTTVPFLTPGTLDERVGQVDNVVFVEGLVEHNGFWYLYYGMADSKIGVATAPASARAEDGEAMAS